MSQELLEQHDPAQELVIQLQPTLLMSRGGVFCGEEALDQCRLAHAQVPSTSAGDIVLGLDGLTA